MNRRRALKLLGGSAAALACGGLAAKRFLLPPAPRFPLASVDDLAVDLVASLAEETRAAVVVDYDHPLRQVHNRGVGGGGLGIDLGTFDRRQRQLLADLLHAGVSATGRERIPEQFFLGFGGVHRMKVLVCGEPGEGPYQVVLTGPHLNLRLGGTSREGVAFGGPQVYGDQRGNERAGLPGNVYRYQLDAARALLRSLTPGERAEVVLADSPIQTRIEVRGSAARLPGLPVASFGEASRDLARALVDGILSTYPDDDAEYARECLEANGGVGGLLFSCYEEDALPRRDLYPVFRLEGPAAVFHFKGTPHVHAFVNVARDGDAPLSVGAVVGENPAVLEGAAAKRFVEDALAAHAGCELAYYDLESAVGRLRAGTIRTGDLYTFESWQNSVALVEVRDLRPPLLAAARARGLDPDPAGPHVVATTEYIARELAGDLGRVRSVPTGPAGTSGTKVRDALVAFALEHGFPSA